MLYAQQQFDYQQLSGDEATMIRESVMQTVFKLISAVLFLVIHISILWQLSMSYMKVKNIILLTAFTAGNVT